MTSPVSARCSHELLALQAQCHSGSIVAVRAVGRDQQRPAGIQRRRSRTPPTAGNTADQRTLRIMQIDRAISQHPDAVGRRVEGDVTHRLRPGACNSANNQLGRRTRMKDADSPTRLSPTNSIIWRSTHFASTRLIAAAGSAGWQATGKMVKRGARQRRLQEGELPVAAVMSSPFGEVATSPAAADRDLTIPEHFAVPHVQFVQYGHTLYRQQQQYSIHQTDRRRDTMLQLRPEQRPSLPLIDQDRWRRAAYIDDRLLRAGMRLPPIQWLRRTARRQPLHGRRSLRPLGRSLGYVTSRRGSGFLRCRTSTGAPRSR